MQSAPSAEAQDRRSRLERLKALRNRQTSEGKLPLEILCLHISQVMHHAIARIPGANHPKLMQNQCLPQTNPSKSNLTIHFKSRPRVLHLLCKLLNLHFTRTQQVPTDQQRGHAQRQWLQ